MALGDDVEERGLVRALDRYRPVALAVCAIALVTWFFPGAEQAGRPAAAGPVPLPPALTGGSSVTTTTAASTASTPAAPSVSLAQRSASTASESPARPPAPSPSRSPAPSATAAATTDRSPPAAPEPLRPARTAWATATAGTPVAAEGVPNGTLPVGTRLGSTDKSSYLTLSGTASTLTLVEDEAGGRAPESAMVVACAITETGWTSGEAQSFDEAPAHDAERCVLGERDEGGSWTFDLSGFADRGGDAGFALVPGPDAPLDFQVALR